MSMKELTRLTKYLNRFEKVIPQFEEKNLLVSKSSVGWQIDHSLKVINGIISQLKTSSNNKKPKRTLLGKFCLLTRYIPRGRGKAEHRGRRQAANARRGPARGRT